jgi:chromosome segregation ATPase
LKWINEYMVVRAPRVPDREALARLAEDLYEGQVATELLVGAEAAKHRLSQAWAAFEAGVQAEIDAVVRHVATEVDRSAERMRMGRAYLTDAQGRIDKLDALISEMRARVSASLSAADEMGGFADRLAADRYDMVADLLAEIAAGDRAVAEAEARVEAQRDRLNALLDGLQYR